MQRTDPSERFHRIFLGPKSGQTEVSLSALPKSGSRSAHHGSVFQQIIKELPGSHISRHLQPDIRGVYTAIDCKTCIFKSFSDEKRIFHITGDLGLQLPAEKRKQS